MWKFLRAIVHNYKSFISGLNKVHCFSSLYHIIEIHGNDAPKMGEHEHHNNEESSLIQVYLQKKYEFSTIFNTSY